MKAGLMAILGLPNKNTGYKVRFEFQVKGNVDTKDVVPYLELQSNCVHFILVY